MIKVSEFMREITIYDMTSGAPVKIPNPAALPNGQANRAAFSPDGRFLAVAHNLTPFMTIYDMSTGTPVKIPEPAALPTGQGHGAAFSPDGGLLAVGYTSANNVCLNIYNMSSGAPVKIPDPPTQVGTSGRGVAFSPDNRFLAIARTATPFVSIYETNIKDSIRPVTISQAAGLSPFPLYAGIGYSKAAANIGDTVSADLIGFQ